jgi:putative chitinase
LKQLTGRENYTNFGKSIGMTAEEAAVYVATEKGAIESACWFWNTKKLNAVADADDIVKMTKIINGGDIGLADRSARYTKAKAVLSSNVVQSTQSSPAPAPVLKPITTTVLKRGSSGDVVKKIQAKLGLPEDGEFRLSTEIAVKKWQTANNLTADGIVGPKTLERLLG